MKKISLVIGIVLASQVNAGTFANNLAKEYPNEEDFKQIYREVCLDVSQGTIKTLARDLNVLKRKGVTQKDFNKIVAQARVESSMPTSEVNMKPELAKLASKNGITYDEAKQMVLDHFEMVTGLSDVFFKGGIIEDQYVAEQKFIFKCQQGKAEEWLSKWVVYD